MAGTVIAIALLPSSGANPLFPKASPQLSHHRTHNSPPPFPLETDQLFPKLPLSISGGQALCLGHLCPAVSTAHSRWVC